MAIQQYIARKIAISPRGVPIFRISKVGRGLKVTDFADVEGAEKILNVLPRGKAWRMEQIVPDQTIYTESF